MEYTNVRDIMDDLNELEDEAFALIDSLGSDNDADLNDWRKISVMCERTVLLKDLISCVADLYLLIGKMESDKDRFEVQKIGQYHFERFNQVVESLLHVGRVWKYRDYRCIDWIKRFTALVEGVEAFFKEVGVIQ